MRGTVPRPWPDTRTVLTQFGPTTARARSVYPAFGAAGIPQGRCPELGGGRAPAHGGRSRAGIADLWVERRRHPGGPFAHPLGVTPQAVYQAFARRRATRREWEGPWTRRHPEGDNVLYLAT